MSNIEEGCIAIVICSQRNDGTIVVVGKFVGRVTGINSINLWEVDKDLTYANEIYPGNIKTYKLCPEHCLQRIDDGKLSEENEAKKEKEIIYEQNRKRVYKQ